MMSLWLNLIVLLDKKNVSFAALRRNQAGEIFTMGLSIYCAIDPDGMEFDSLPYIRKRALN